MTDQDHLDRINALTRNARQTWFALLAALVFVGITLMGVEHIDFYGVDRATELPLVSVEVPTPYFFYTAPILIAAIYGYFHLYLIRLFDALGAAPARLNGIRLGDAIAPWLVADAALDYRARKRKDNCTTPRVLEISAALLNLMLAWGFGLIVLMFLYWQSLPARSFVMSSIALASLAVSLFAGFGSFETMRKRLRDGDAHENICVFKRWFDYPVTAIGLAATVFGTYLLTEGPTEYLAPLDLSGENIVQRPAEWLSYGDAKAEFRSDWCRRQSIEDCTDLHDRESAFADEFSRRRHVDISDMRRPDWRGSRRPKPDFRNAQLARSFVVGADLSNARMEGADLRLSVFEGTRFRMAQLQGTDFSDAGLEEANFFEATMERAIFNGARMEKADLRRADMQKTYLSRTNLHKAILWETQLQDAVFRAAKMERAFLREARMERTDLEEAQLERAVFDFSRLTGTRGNVNALRDTNLSGTRNNGGLLRFVNLTLSTINAQTDWRNVFLDGSVTVKQSFRTQMGEGNRQGPCQWVNKMLGDAELFGLWRGWIEISPLDITPSWHRIAPEGFEDVTPIPPPPGCEWKTGPMPGIAPEATSDR